MSQKEQQLWEVVLNHCQEETPGQRDIRALTRSRRRQWCNKEFLLIFGPDPRLPFLPGEIKCRENSENLADLIHPVDSRKVLDVFLPCSIGGWLTAAQSAALPYAVYQVVADGT